MARGLHIPAFMRSRRRKGPNFTYIIPDQPSPNGRSPARRVVHHPREARHGDVHARRRGEPRVRGVAAAFDLHQSHIHLSALMSASAYGESRRYIPQRRCWSSRVIGSAVELFLEQRQTGMQEGRGAYDSGNICSRAGFDAARSRLCARRRPVEDVLRVVA